MDRNKHLHRHLSLRCIEPHKSCIQQLAIYSFPCDWLHRVFVFMAVKMENPEGRSEVSHYSYFSVSAGFVRAVFKT
jgi:hypothetical protein